MTKLTIRQILQLHAMHATGQSNADIAKALNLNRNSVSAHLAGEIAYPSPVYKSISISAPLRADRWLSLRQAAAWIPGHPSASKMQTIVAGRSWGGRKIPELRTRMIGRRRMTTIKAIRRFVAELYPEGIWITEDALMNFVAYDVIRGMRFARLGWHKGTKLPFGNPIYATPLTVAARVARSTGGDLVVPAEVVHRATTIQRHVGTAVI